MLGGRIICTRSGRVNIIINTYVSRDNNIVHILIVVLLLHMQVEIDLLQQPLMVVVMVNIKPLL